MIALDLATTESWIKVIGGVVTVGGALVAAFKALTEWRRSTEQRAEELQLRQREFRHKQAIFARDLMSGVFADARARAALRMLDWTQFDYSDEEGVKYTVSENEIAAAMDPMKSADDKQAFIRTRFEALFDQIEQLEHLITLEIVNFADVAIAFRYYMRNLMTFIPRIGEFFDHFDYPGAKGFVLRFEHNQQETNQAMERAADRHTL